MPIADLEEATATLNLLRSLPTNGARLARIIARTGSARAALAASAQIWLAERLRRPTLDRAERARLAPLIDRDLAWLAAADHHLIGAHGDDYPPLLARAPSRPAYLFVAGDPVHLWRAQVAIVGARSATRIGLEQAADFARGLGRAGLTITSGLAEGIDGAAHRAALEADQPTVAVCGTGLAELFPRCHRALAEAIVERGALVSEFVPDTRPRPEHFPRRNRIIAGLALGTLVIEASVKSGSLITARLASEAGRDVFAVPGAISSPVKRGCHKLIRDGAKLVESANDLLEDLAPLARLQGQAIAARLADDADSAANREHPPHASASSSPSDAALLALLDDEPQSLDTLVDRSALEGAEIAAALVMLELDGLVAADASGRYSRRLSSS